MTFRTQINTVISQSNLALWQTQRCLVRAPNGRLWALYVGPPDYADTSDLLVAYSDDDGLTWTEEVAVANAHFAWAYEGMSLLVNSASVPIIIWTYDVSTFATEAIKYVSRAGGAWGIPETVHAQAGISWLHACIDSTDVIHIAYKRAGTNTPTYITGVSGAWGVPEVIENVPGNNLEDLVVNSMNEPSVLILDGTGLYTRTRTGGVWAARSTAMLGSFQVGYFQMAVDSNDYLHIAARFEEVPFPWDYLIIYIRQTGAGWQAYVEIDRSADDWCCPSIQIDSSDNVYIIWQHEMHAAVETVWWCQVVAGAPGAITVLDATILQPAGEPSVFSSLWHRWPVSGVPVATRCPACLVLTENGTDADVLYFGALPSVLTISTLPATGVT